MVKLYARVAGVLLVLLGVMGFLAGGQPLFGVLNVDPWENLAHLLSGALLAYAGFFQRDEVFAAIVVLALGVTFTLIGVTGFVYPTLFGLLPSGLHPADDLLHLALGAFGIAAVETGRGDRRKRGTT
jgi:hypothetical protein